VDVAVEHGRVTQVRGNRRAPLYHGYTCPKGRATPLLHNGPDRLLHSLKRLPDGRFIPITSDDLADELAVRIGRLLERHEPRAIAAYLSGGVIEQPAASAMMISFLRAIGSPMLFSAATIDQPGMAIGYALHGRWAGGRILPEQRDIFVIVGGNPINSKQYLPQNPGMQIKGMRRGGGKLVVVDPRRSETARLADIHLQLRPGEDPAVLACLINLLLEQGDVDRAFVTANAEGFDALADAVRPFTAARVAERAGVPEAELRAIARALGEAKTGDIALGTGPSMATRGLLSSYLALCINTLRGWWAREGDPAMHPSVLLPPREFRAQPIAPRPAWGFGEKTRIKSFEETVAGMPLAALPEEILTPGPEQVRALFLHGGAVNSWPQTARTREALAALDTLVIHDTVLSPTARLADYVIATKMQFEIPSVTVLNELISAGGHSGYGWADPYASALPAVVDPPEGSDLLESWQIYYRIAQRLGLPMALINWKSEGTAPPALDMTREPTTEQIYDLMCAGSAVPLSEVRRYPDGRVFDDVRKTVIGREPGCTARLQLADPDMIAALREVAEEAPRPREAAGEFPFLLIPSRLQNTTNTFARAEGALPWRYNPAFLHPADMAELGLAAGAEVRIRSRHGEVRAIVEVDEGLRRGVVALMHGFGEWDSDDPRVAGTNVNRLTAWNDDFEKYTGMPRMGALPVAIQPSGRRA